VIPKKVLTTSLEEVVEPAALLKLEDGKEFVAVMKAMITKT
jgi:molybdopterin-binding protein